MHSAFTTFASSRFVDREAVLASLRTLAERLKEKRRGIRGVHLFGSFAAGTATPRSDADVVIEVVPGLDHADRRDLADAAQSAFLTAPVPVDLFVRDVHELQEDHGIAAVVAREGLRLA